MRQAGAAGGLSVIIGLVSTPSAVSVKITFSSGATASGLIPNGRFAVIAPWASEACSEACVVRARRERRGAGRG